jgi:acetyl esterase/lipase
VTDAFDPHAKRFLDMLALKGGSVAALGIEERRAAFANLLRFCAPGSQIAGVEEIDPAGRTIRMYQPEPRSATAMVFLHGGGLVAGSLETHDALCRTLAAASGCNVFAVDYRLAPEHPFPAALDDTLAGLEWIFKQAPVYGLERIGLAGDSAGGALAAIAAAGWRVREKPDLAFQLLLCPILDFAGETPSRHAFASPVLDQATLDHDIALYTAGRVGADDPRISPLRATDFSGVPPTFLHTAQCDPLRDEGAAYADKLRAAGVEVHHTRHAGMPHLFYALSGVIPAAKATVAAMGAELSAWLATSESRQH